MSNSLLDVLNTVSSEDNDKYTHVTYFPKQQKWNVGPHKNFELWEEYCQLLAKGEDDLCLAEVNNSSFAPLIVDMNFRFDDDVDDDILEVDEFLLSLVSCCQQVIIETFELSPEQKELTCFVFEADHNYVEVAVDDRRYLRRLLKLQFPYCRIETKVGSQVVLPNIIKKFRLQNILRFLDQQPSNDWEDIIDMKVMDRPILVYGSRTNTSEPIKKLQYIWGPVSKDHIDSSLEIEAYPPSKVLSFSTHHDVMCNIVKLKQFECEDMEDSYNYWFPYLMSINAYDGVLKVKEITKSSGTRYSLRVIPKKEDEKLNLCLIFLKMISDKKFTEKHTLIDIGKALYIESDGSEEGLRIWKQFAKTELDFDDLYPKFYNSGITVKTLAWYAKEDSPGAYEIWHKGNIKKYLEVSLNLVDNDVAQAFYKCYWLDFVFVPSGRAGVWYQFKNHKWHRVDLAIDIKALLSRDFRSKYDELQAFYTNEKSRSQDENTRNAEQKKIDACAKLTRSLGKLAFKETITKNVREFFCDERFGILLDMNNNCIGHLNCVSETCEDRIIFRNGKPEDYVSKSTGVRIDPNLNWDHPTVKKVMKWFGQIFVDKDILNTFLKYGASWFIGANPEKLVPCMTGEGDNSKSMLIKAFEAAFGEYCFKIPSHILTGGQKGNGPTPELAQAKGARGGISDELEEEEILKTGFLKRITGGDTFFARKCNEDGGKITPTFKFILVCNKVPKMNSVQKAIKNRFIILPFLSTWSDDAPEDEAEQYETKHFKKDMFFEKQLSGFAPAILWIFAQKYIDYLREGLKIPQVIRDYTKAYWDDVDIYEIFRSEFVGIAYKDSAKKVQDKEAKVTVQKLYTEFKIWFKHEYERVEIPDKRSFKLELTKIYGKPAEGKYWYGICLLTEQPVDIQKVE